MVGVRSLVLMMVVLGGCVADAEGPPPVVITTTHVEVTKGDGVESEIDVCALAAELPSEDVCSLICDPQAMADRLVEDGSKPGTCYQLFCALPGDEFVLVGVCLRLTP